MKRLILISELGVITGLLLMTSFFFVRLWIGMDPSSPLAWQAFLEMPDLIREPANYFYYKTGLPVPYCAALFACATATGIFLLKAANHVRLRFLYFNAAVLTFFVCLGLDLFQLPAPAGDITQSIANILSCLRQVEPMQAAFLALLTVSLFNTHRVILLAPGR